MSAGAAGPRNPILYPCTVSYKLNEYREMMLFYEFGFRVLPAVVYTRHICVWNFHRIYYRKQNNHPRVRNFYNQIKENTRLNGITAGTIQEIIHCRVTIIIYWPQCWLHFSKRIFLSNTFPKLQKIHIDPCVVF